MICKGDLSPRFGAFGKVDDELICTSNAHPVFSKGESEENDDDCACCCSGAECLSAIVVMEIGNVPIHFVPMKALIS